MVQIVFFMMLAAFVTVLIVGFFQFVFQSHIKINKRIQQFTVPKKVTSHKGAGKPGEERGKITKGPGKIWRGLQEKTEQHMSLSMAKGIERKLRDAGYLYKLSAGEFRLIQLTLSAVFILFFFVVFARPSTNMGMLILLACSSGLLGLALPNFYLSRRKTKRIEVIQKTMPDFFDMVNLSIEAGMGLDAAINSVCRKFPGPLSDEFKMSIEDMRLGISRREAFTNLRNRVPSRHFQSIISSLIQADQLGIGTAKVLKALTQRIRENQREVAREQAMKAPIKMMFPMIFFIFPSLFIVILGPLVIYLVTKGFGG